jgi:ceramide glucosyltransferase
MNALLGGLEDGAMLATGLPSYIPARGLFSGVLAEFVNSSAILTYLPVLALHPPLTINGMCYAMRSRDVRRLDLFKRIERSLTDDLAVAQVVRRDRGRIFQSVQPQLISTTVSSSSALLRILHRWFVFTRLLVQGETVTTKLMLVAAYGVPPLLLWLLLVTTLQSAVFAPLALTLILRVVVLVGLQRRFYGRFTHRPFSSLLMEMAQPLFLVSGYVKRTIVWRKRRIEVRTVDDFRYV